MARCLTRVYLPLLFKIGHAATCPRCKGRIVATAGPDDYGRFYVRHREKGVGDGRG